MSAIQSATFPLDHPVTISRRARTYLVAVAAVFIGSLAIAVLMTASILLSGPLPSWSGAPMPEPMPQPSAESGLDR
jgi:hypothetical protein